MRPRANQHYVPFGIDMSNLFPLDTNILTYYKRNVNPFFEIFYWKYMESRLGASNLWEHSIL